MRNARSPQFILSLAGGVLILLGGIISLLWLLVGFQASFDPLVDLRNMLGEQEFRAFQIRYAVAGLSSGVAVILISLMLRMKPEESKRWGFMIIVLSAMSILGMGGFIIGMALGIIGGAIAIIKGKSLKIDETTKPVVNVGTEVRAQETMTMVYKCSSCDIEFKTDEELKRHVLRMHMEKK
jgi:hypothetical protein